MTESQKSLTNQETSHLSLDADSLFITGLELLDEVQRARLGSVLGELGLQITTQSMDLLTSQETEGPEDFLVRAEDFMDYARSNNIPSRVATKAWTVLFVKRQHTGYSAGENWKSSGLRVVEVEDDSEEGQLAISGNSLVEAVQSGTINNLYDFGDVTGTFVKGFVDNKSK